ncbi:hypothetical protein AGMMS49960_10190 [Betaproteobacteria bacterium]|nr:hypothetical protein AGMMS49543_26720 [Betaproteobacteria bacterium]GHU00946.1 hypothetical protein AGMMS49960_10190 [Betaproteobacteria bacterium]GHU19883.1 hypothetical protein AGMMS50243_12990 [Betaproteobacteria bacterium]
MLTTPLTSPTLQVRFYRTGTGVEPVRDWLKALVVLEHVEGDIWEVRTKLSTRIARVLFVLEGNTMVLLHSFIKKQQKTPKPELDVARDRLKLIRRRT